MTTYIQKKIKMFRKRPEFLKPDRKRSEARLKTYPSSTDIRNWCDVVEDRRQHILEIIQKGCEKCLPNLIPVDVLLDMLMAMANADIAKLKKCLKQLWTFIYGLNLNEEDKIRLEELTNKMDDICTSLHKAEANLLPGLKSGSRGIESGWDQAEPRSDYDVKGQLLPEANLLPGLKSGSRGIESGWDQAEPQSDYDVKGQLLPEADLLPGLQSRSKGIESEWDQADPYAECDPKCPALVRHEKEKAEVEAFLRDTLDEMIPPTTDATVVEKIRSPGRIVTRIKGLQPGFEVINDPSRATHLTIKGARPGVPIQSSEKALKLRSASDEPSQDTAGPEKLRSASYEPSQAIVRPDRLTTQVTVGRDRLAPQATVGPYQLAPQATVGPDQLAAQQSLCKEQQDKIQELTKERDFLKTKLDACLRELDNFKKLQTVANPSLPASCQQEIEALEAEINIMRSGNPSPEEEAEIIRKEVAILKRYCSKLKDVETENEKLKVELGSRVTIKDSEPSVEAEKLETLKDKLKNLEELTKERDMLANKVHMLEKQLLQYQDLPTDIELLKNRSDMLDSVMEERDNLSQKVKLMKGMEEELQKFKSKAERVDELEKEIKNMNRGGRSSGIELKKTQSRASSLEIEMHNLKSEKDAMQKRIENMKKEMENQKAKSTEAEMLRLERDRLQIKLNELGEIQDRYEEMIQKMKIFDNIKAERDMYKQKYEDVLEMECKCEMLKAQIEEARTVSRERDQLQKQVDDLEACICEQEEEIKSLVIQVESMSRTKQDSNNRMTAYQDEMMQRERLLVASQEHAVNASQSMAAKIRELEKLLHNAEHMLLQKECHIKCLENELNSKSGSINVSRKLNKQDLDAVEMMRKELEAAKAENKRLQDIANRMLTVSGDDHVRKMLKQSECAVKRVVQELGKQYKDWEHTKPSNPKGRLTSKRDCLCHSTGGDISSGDDCEKLREELEELQKEKKKLEFTVKQLQGGGIISKDSAKCPTACGKKEK